MNIRDELLREHSRAQSEKIANWIGKDKSRFAELMHIFLRDEGKATQRSASVLSVVSEQYKQLAVPYMADMINRIQEPGIHDGIKRNVVRILQNLDIPEDLQAQLMNVCFDMLADPQEAIAIRCFSMTILANLAVIYPDIKHELISVIEDGLQHEPSAAFKNRGKRTIKALTKQ